MTLEIFSRAARARTPARARVTLRQKIFIAFLDELGNFKHFETYFFWRFLGQKIAILAIWSPPVAPDGQIGEKLKIKRCLGPYIGTDRPGHLNFCF